MAEISAKLVKELREKTGAGMMDCKAALTESQGEMEAAIDWLRKKGLAKAAKKAGRIAAEGLIGIATAAKKGAVVEVNSETDFVARNAQFQAMVQMVAKLALKAKGDLDTLKATKLPRKTKTVDEAITELVATIGEHMSLRRTALITVKQGVVASYVHGQIADGLGKIGVLVGLQSTGDVAKLEEFGRKVAMHVAAATPIALDINEVDPAVVEREKAVFRDQAKQSGKPDAVIEKMVEGRLRKFYEEVVLLKQTFVLDAEKTVEAAAKDAEKSVGAPIKITAFVRFALGEGIDKGESDFAAEVAAAAGKS